MPPKTDPAQSAMIWPPQAYDGKTRFDVWQMQLEMYMDDLDITDTKKKARALLQHIGSAMLEKIIDWMAPDKPQEAEYKALVTLIKDKCTKTPNFAALRVKFFNERQQQGQTLEEYFAHMSSLFGQCKMDDMKADDFGVLAVLKGIASDETRQFLMTSSTEMKKICDVQALASKFEQGKAAAKAIKGDGGSTSSNSYSMNVVGKGYKCKWCGENHQPGKEKCPANGKACNKCGKRDHYAKVCKSSTRQQQNVVEQDRRESLNGLYPYSILTVSSSIDQLYPPSLIKAKLDGTTVVFQYDTGAAVTVISKDVWNAIGKPELRPSSIQLESYNQRIAVIGECKVMVQVAQQVKEQVVIVVPKGKSLLGRNWIKAFGKQLYETYNHCKDPELRDKGVYKQHTVTLVDPKDRNTTKLMHVPMQGKEKQASGKVQKQSYTRFMNQKAGNHVDRGTVIKKFKKAKLSENSFVKSELKLSKLYSGGIDRDDHTYKFPVSKSKTTVSGSECSSLREGDGKKSNFQKR